MLYFYYDMLLVDLNNHFSRVAAIHTVYDVMSTTIENRGWL